MSLADWRKVAGRVSATFSTPLDQVLARPWDDVMLWWAEAQDIDRERWAPMRHLVKMLEA